MTSLSVVAMESCDFEAHKECYYTRLLWTIVPIGLIVVGTIGNVFNVIILLRRRMIKLTTSVYLLSLSGGDLTFIWTRMFLQTLKYGYETDLQIMSRIVCKVMTLATGISAAFSVWLLVLMTMERVLLTRWPVTARIRLTRRNTIKTVIITFICCILFNSHLIFSADIRPVQNSASNVTKVLMECTYVDGHSIFYKQLWPLLILIVLNLIPIVVILLGNLTVLSSIYLQRRKIRSVSDEQPVPRKVKSATKMLFLVSAMFISTTIPFTIGNVILSLQPVRDSADFARHQLIYTALRLLLYCNFTFNFFLYFISGTLFKQEWKEIIKSLHRVIYRVFLNREIVSEYNSSNSIMGNPRNQDTLDTI